MKIIFTPSDNNLAGAFQSMVRLCTILKNKHNCDILVILRKKGTGQQLLDENGLRYQYIPSFNWIIPKRPRTIFRMIELVTRQLTKPFAILYNNFVAKNKFKKLLIEEKPDLIHLNTSYIYIPAIAAYELGVPVVWHIREFLEEDQSKKIWNTKKGYNLISKATEIITISNSLYNKYASILNNANIVKIYNGLDDNYYKNLEHTILKKDTINLLMVGTINSSKGQKDAIEACQRVVQNGHCNLKLTIVGEINKYAKNLRKEINDKGLSSYFDFVGLQKDTEKYYSKSDIVLVCSKFEAFGRVTVEAMMSGCLVIGSNTGGTIELIKDKKTGYLYNVGNVEDLANKIIYSIDHRSESIKIAKQGQNDMLNNFTAESNAKNIYNEYNKIIKRKDVYKK